VPKPVKNNRLVDYQTAPVYYQGPFFIEDFPSLNLNLLAAIASSRFMVHDCFFNVITQRKKALYTSFFAKGLK
jgi:hypothetical protein